MAGYTQVECLDFSQFQDTIKKMRLLDDTIIYALNSELPTESFKAQQDYTGTCKQLYTRMEDSYKTRENVFNKCLEYSRNRVNELKAKRDIDPNNPGVLKDLRKEQSKIRLMETELGVEDIIKSRARKVFYDRCRPFYLPDNMGS